MKCPMCNKGNLKKGSTSEYIFGEYLGEFPADVCINCKESFTTEQTTKEIERAAKNKGLWGFEASTKVTKTGNSLAVRIPKKIASHFKLKHLNEVTIYPEGKRIIIEKI